MSSWEVGLGLILGVPLLIMALTILINVPFLLCLKAGAKLSTNPLVSVLIPARNEASIIGQTLMQLRQSSYPNFEIILLDDNSTDGTAAVADVSAENASNFRLISGQPLPAGWLGKNWACHQLSQAAQGDILLFTDADVRWQPDAISAVAAAFERTQADTLTVWPTQTTLTWGERLVVPLISLATIAYLPLLGVHYLPFAAFAAANGQCLAFRREAYQTIGGHAAVQGNIVEDVALARLTKQHKLRLRLFDGNQLVACRMYQNWDEVRAGFSKNILAGHANSIVFLLASTLFHWLVFIAPLLWGIAALALSWNLALPLTLLAVGISIRAATAMLTHQRPLDALWMPASVVLMTRIAVQSIVWKRRGKTAWKGRIVG